MNAANSKSYDLPRYSDLISVDIVVERVRRVRSVRIKKEESKKRER